MSQFLPTTNYQWPVLIDNCLCLCYSLTWAVLQAPWALLQSCACKYLWIVLQLHAPDSRYTDHDSNNITHCWEKLQLKAVLSQKPYPNVTNSNLITQLIFYLNQPTSILTSPILYKLTFMPTLPDSCWGRAKLNRANSLQNVQVFSSAEADGECQNNVWHKTIS